MLTRLNFQAPVLTGDWSKDGPNLVRFLTEWKNRLDTKGALFIDEAQITASQGIKFPATAVASTDVNTLDDYEEGSWTPALSFATPGNLSISYTVQEGEYTKIGNRVDAHFAINPATFTHTTASGDLQISGLPFAVGSGYSFARFQGGLRFGGITKATYTNFTVDATAGNSFLIISAGGSGVAASTVTAADVPSGGTVVLRGSVTYFV